MRCTLMTTLGLVVFAGTAMAQPSLPATFRARTVASPEGVSIFVRSGGSGPAVVLLHGYAETSDSWGPLATALAKSYTVVVPDLRGIGRSSRPAGGYDKNTQAADIRAVVTTLGWRTTTGPERRIVCSCSSSSLCRGLALPLRVRQRPAAAERPVELGV